MVKTNININREKFTEFIKILVPEAKEDVLEIEGLEEEKGYTVITSNGKNTIEFTYEKINKNFSDQLDVMARISLLKLYNKDYKWGSLIGVRPTKIVHKLFNSGYNFHYIESVLTDFYQVSKEKAGLLIDIAKRELRHMESETIGIYIGIAYCPTRCTYCSFPSYLKEGKYLERFDEYYKALLYEIREIGKLVQEQDLEVNTIYIGGGTPSILSEEEMDKMLKVISQNYDVNKLKEFSCELGRIDMISEEKLEVLKRWKVNRISINPQTFNLKTLKKINRDHDQDKFDIIFKKAKEMDFTVNMDLIIGLPGEMTDDILYTLQKTENYNVDNLTIHNLAIKKSSKLKKDSYSHEKSLNYKEIYNKIYKITRKKGLYPYYMYRQKNSFEWGENTGYSIKDKESVYNIETIEENKTIIGIGAGAITKLITGDIKNQKIERIINPKDPLMWVDELKERLEKKKIKIREAFSGR